MSDDDEADRPMRIDVEFFNPRLSARILHSPREAETATDFDVIVEISTSSPRDPGTERRYEGEVSLWMDSRGWQPCRSTNHGPDAGWICGGLLFRLIEVVRCTAGPIGVDVSRRLIEVLSGAGWPASSPFAASTLGRENYHDAVLELGPSAIIPGDVVEHTNSRRRGIVVKVDRIHGDGTAEHLVRDGLDESHWNSRHIRRISQRDPYRRYLAMVAAEDDAERRVRRARHRRGRHGGSLPPAAWDKAYWHLCNRQRLGVDGGHVHVNLGRERWATAALDCLDRRDHAQQTAWLDVEKRREEASAPSPFTALSRDPRRDP